jgi:putative monooxygenase
MRIARAALLALVAACSQPAPAPTLTTPTPPVATPTIDARVVSDDEKLAAIQKAMNELDEAAQGCWALAATEGYDIAGELEAGIGIQERGAKVELIDRIGSAKLRECMKQVLEKYPWPPPLHGQAIRLPFAFKAPDGQSVIDRRLVETKTQDKVSVAVLLDQSNTGNAAASMFEVGMAADASTGWRKTERAELWYFLTPAKINTGLLDAGDMLFVRAGGVRTIGARSSELHAVLVVAPGGREGAARGGALPTPPTSDKAQMPVVTLRAKDAKTYGPATIYLDSAVYKDAPLSASVLQLAAGAKVPEHLHANETELIYVLEGSGTMTIAGQEVAVTSTSVIQIPPNTRHAFSAAENVRAVQLYTPGGPEQRFKQPKKP